MDKLLIIQDQGGHTVRIQTSNGFAADICKALLMYSDVKSVSAENEPIGLYEKRQLAEALGEGCTEK